MRLPILPMIVLVLINAGIDLLIYRYLKKQSYRVGARIHLWLACILQAMIIIAVCLPRRSGSDGTLLVVMWVLYGYLSVYVPKLIYLVFIGIGGIPRLWHGRRWKLAAPIGLLAGAGVFVAMWWGALFNRFKTQLVEVDVVSENLPEGFDGYRIVQISDLHVGTFGNDTTYLSRVVDEVNALDADVIFFTGDIVNRRTSELVPMVQTLSRLKARDGVYSILGNHDYGDYSEWETPMAKEENMAQLYDLQDRMGWRLLLNETEFIGRDGDSIAIVGVENVGDPPFKVYGDLNSAYPSLGDSVYKILLTHNPAHWVADIADNDSVNIGLSLSGHTHAMQMEVDILGHRLSPAAWRYPTWGGMYTDKTGTHKLYVNIGMGTVGIPARIGATPEITVLTLKRPESDVD
ncbi:MAG: metallophosphoesterase [Pseudoflavonifractor sp.]|nr:metallophosphoesterase [Pseudoflavonifractor sp.]